MRRSTTLRDQARRNQTPPLQGRGKGWGVEAERLDRAQEHARRMRGEPTEPEKRLWRHLSNRQLGGYKFRRQAVIGSAIADFLCPRKGVVVEVDGHTHGDQDADARRDLRLTGLGYRVFRITNAEVMDNMDGVLRRLLDVMESLPDRRQPPHPNPSPEGEGLEAVAAQKLLEIGLPGRLK